MTDLRKDKETLFFIEKIKDDDFSQYSIVQLNDYINKCSNALNGDLRHSTSPMTMRLRDIASIVSDKLYQAKRNHPETLEQEKKAREEIQRKEEELKLRKEKGQCLYCGSEVKKSIFTRKCIKCGKDQSQSKFWEYQGLCRYCGGEFISSEITCRLCGKINQWRAHIF